jgi:hypothetical protein
MAHWPRTFSGNLIAFLLLVAATSLLVQIAVAMPSLILVATVGVVTLIVLAVKAWRRRIDAARERAWVGEFSFGDVVHRIRAREAARELSHAAPSAPVGAYAGTV